MVSGVVSIIDAHNLYYYKIIIIPCKDDLIILR